MQKPDLVCECGGKKYEIVEAVEGPGEITVRCVACSLTYKCTGVYPISADLGGEPVSGDNPFIKVEFKSGL